MFKYEVDSEGVNKIEIYKSRSMQYFKRHSEIKMPHCILGNENNVIPTFIFIQKSIFVIKFVLINTNI